MKVTIPTYITLFRLLLVFILPFLEIGSFALVSLAIIIVLFDAVDGYVARKLKQVTKTGAALDKFTDFMFILVVLVSFFKLTGYHFMLLGIIILTRGWKQYYTKSATVAPEKVTKFLYDAIFVIVILHLAGVVIPYIMSVITALFCIETIVSRTKSSA